MSERNRPRDAVTEAAALLTAAESGRAPARIHAPKAQFMERKHTTSVDGFLEKDASKTRRARIVPMGQILTLILAQNCSICAKRSGGGKPCNAQPRIAVITASRDAVCDRGQTQAQHSIATQIFSKKLFKRYHVVIHGLPAVSYSCGRSPYASRTFFCKS